MNAHLRSTDVAGTFFAAGTAFLIAAATVGAFDAAAGLDRGRWLALHLAFLGGVSQLVLGASQFFLSASLMTDPPPRALVRGQLAAWNAGTVLLAAGVLAGSDPLVVAGVAGLVSALACYGAALTSIHRRSLQGVPFATRWYSAAVLFLVPGILVGTWLALELRWAHGNLLASHMALNVAGWFGAAIVGTLHTFYPSLARARMPRPALEPRTWAAWIGGTTALAAGYAASLDVLTVAGWAGLAAAALMIAGNVAGAARAAPRPLTLPARLVGTAQAFLVAGVLVAGGAAVLDGPDRVLASDSGGAIAVLLLAGWVGATVLGSLLHLVSVVARARGADRRPPAPTAGPDIAVTLLLAASVASLATSRMAGAGDLAAPGLVGLVLAYAVLGARIIRATATLLASRLRV